MTALCTATMLAVFLAADSGGSGIPSAALSSEDPCLIVCPSGDFRFHVTLRNVSNNPIAAADVALDFSQCPGFTPCPDVGDTLTFDPTTRLLRRSTNAFGLATFVIRAGGVCGGAAVRMYGNGVPLGSRSLASPDQDGDLAVTNGDVSLVQSKVGTSDPTADLDCSGSVTPADASIVAAHSGHTCTAPTSSGRRSWGRVKLLYR